MRIFIQGLALVALSAVYTLGANAEDSRAEPVIYVLAGALLDVESGKTLRDQAMIIIGSGMIESGITAGST